MFGVGYQELLVVMVIVLIIFGPKNLPKLASSMGKAIRDFKSGLSGVDDEIRGAMDEAERPEKPEKAHPSIDPPSKVTSAAQAREPAAEDKSD